MSKKPNALRGMRDTSQEDLFLHDYVLDRAKKSAFAFGYEEISLPILEESSVFHRLGEQSDVISKETYTFLDRDKTSITLRPEFTASIVRAFLSGSMGDLLPVRTFSHGPLFRHERPQKCRYRQFHQINYELIGCGNWQSDVEILLLSWHILKKINIKSEILLHINTLGNTQSRNNYKEALVKYLSKFQSELSEDSQRRLQNNPLRILDSKDAKDRAIIENAPSFAHYLDDESRLHFDNVINAINDFGIPHYIDTKLVRGFDYYTHTVFEYVTKDLGAQGAILAGGRYNHLIEMMGGANIPAIGFAAGIERISELIKATIAPEDTTKIMISSLAQDSITLKIQEHLLKAHENISCIIEYSANLSKIFKKADKNNVSYVVLHGLKEVAKNMLRIRDMKTGRQSDITMLDLLHYKF